MDAVTQPTPTPPPPQPGSRGGPQRPAFQMSGPSLRTLGGPAVGIKPQTTSSQNDWGRSNPSSTIRRWLEEGVGDCGLVDCAMAPSWWTDGYRVRNNTEATEHKL